MTLSSSPRDCTGSPSLQGLQVVSDRLFHLNFTYGLRAQEVVDTRLQGRGLRSLCLHNGAVYRTAVF